MKVALPLKGGGGETVAEERAWSKRKVGALPPAEARRMIRTEPTRSEIDAEKLTVGIAGGSTSPFRPSVEAKKDGLAQLVLRLVPDHHFASWGGWPNPWQRRGGTSVTSALALEARASV